jgi:hypothetical protein
LLPAFVVVAAAGVSASAVQAQPLGTFRWQLQPFCNIVTVAVTQNGAVYRLEGTDDQCGNGADAAAVVGMAFPNADGSIGFGLTIVTTPGGRPLHVDAEITLPSFSGTWRDSTAASGRFVFTPGGGAGGTPRPLPSPGVPSTIQFGVEGALVAGGQEGIGSAPASGPGTRLMWYPGKAAFRAGSVASSQWDDASVGTNSAAMGRNTVASGTNSVAMGSGTTAEGPNSLAGGSSTRAIGSTSTAMGSSTTAEGPNSVALGSSTRAVGSTSTAMGSSTTADGPNSLAIGSSTQASGSSSMALGSASVASGPNALAGGASSVASGSAALAFGAGARAVGSGGIALGSRAVAAGVGSFAFGDSSAGEVSAGTNEFKVRASGGVFLFSNATLNVGVALAPSGNQWLTLSDARAKHRFRDLDGEAVLTKIAAMPVTEWSYTAQDEAIRHMGPTAQDFHAAFGLGEDPLRIGTLDADGVALAAVKALETRTRSQSARIEALERALADALAAIQLLREIRR